MAERRRLQRGQVTVEFALTWVGVLLPLTMGLIFTSQILWIWHGVNEYTRLGASYATTHCWMSSASNVTDFMRQNVPPIVSQDQFQSGGVQINVNYFGKQKCKEAVESVSRDDKNGNLIVEKDQLLHPDYRVISTTLLGRGWRQDHPRSSVAPRDRDARRQAPAPHGFDPGRRVRRRERAALDRREGDGAARRAHRRPGPQRDRQLSLPDPDQPLKAIGCQSSGKREFDLGMIGRARPA